MIHLSSTDKGLCQAQYDTTASCQQGKVEQVYIKSKCRLQCCA